MLSNLHVESLLIVSIQNEFLIYIEILDLHMSEMPSNDHHYETLFKNICKSMSLYLFFCGNFINHTGNHFGEYLI